MPTPALPLSTAAGAAAAAAPAHPWRRVLRTIVAAAVPLLPVLPELIDTLGVSRALPGVAGFLAVTAGITRLLAHPKVEVFLRRVAPALAARDVAAEAVVAQVVTAPAGTPVVVAGEAHTAPTGKTLGAAGDTVVVAGSANTEGGRVKTPARTRASRRKSRTVP